MLFTYFLYEKVGWLLNFNSKLEEIGALIPESNSALFKFNFM